MSTKPPRQPKLNDARRLLHFLKRAGELPGISPAADGWMHAAGISREGMSDDEKITLAYDVVADFRRLLARVDVRYGEMSSSDDYKGVLAHFRNIANAQYVHGQWAVVQQHFLAGPGQVSLGIIADALPNDEECSDFESAKALLTEIEALLRQVERSDLPVLHKHYAEMMLSRLRKALRDYMMFGTQYAHEYSIFLHGLEAELSQNTAHLSEEQATLSPESQTLIDKVLDRSRKATELCKSAYYITSTAILAYKGAEVALPLLNRVAAKLL